jgi:hypothetical protein
MQKKLQTLSTLQKIHQNKKHNTKKTLKVK